MDLETADQLMSLASETQDVMLLLLFLYEEYAGGVALHSNEETPFWCVHLGDDEDGPKFQSDNVFAALLSACEYTLRVVRIAQHQAATS